MEEKISVEVRLFAHLRDLLQPEKRGVEKLEVSPNLTIDELMDEIGIVNKEIMIVMINGRRKTSHKDKVSKGDRISIFPPVGGG